MEETPKNAFPYPADSDEPDGPTQIGALALALDRYPFGGSQAGGTYLGGGTKVFTGGETAGSYPMGGSGKFGASGGQPLIPIFSSVYYAQSDGHNPGLISMRGACVTNDTAPGSAPRINLYPVTATGASGALILTAGTAVAGLHIDFANTADSEQTDITGPLALPGAGLYALGVVIGAASIPAACQMMITADLVVQNFHED